MPSHRHFIISIPLLITFNLFIPSTSFSISSTDKSSSTSSLKSIASCTSGNDNTTIVWPPPSSSSSSSSSADCIVQKRSDVEKEFMKYLFINRMPYDIPITGSLGFNVTLGSDDDDNNRETTTTNVVSDADDNVITSNDVVMTSSSSLRLLSPSVPSPPLPDGLSNGIIPVTINLSLDAKFLYPWTSTIPKPIYLEYVLPHASVDESRTNWRPLLSSTLTPFLSSLLSSSPSPTTKEVVHTVNTHLWSSLGNGDPIIFKAGQTPLIYDPMSIIVHRYGSCSGLSILFVSALRSVGIAARVAGTPAWNGNIENGNHSWVEIYIPEEGRWMFLESAPAFLGVPDVNPQPCDFWFCNKDKFDGSTRVYAARFDRRGAGRVYFPMSWDLRSRGVPGEDRTSEMTALCSMCG